MQPCHVSFKNAPAEYHILFFNSFNRISLELGEYVTAKSILFYPRYADVSSQMRF